MLEGRKVKMPIAHVCIFSSSEKQEETGAEDNMCPHQTACCQHNVSVSAAKASWQFSRTGSREMVCVDFTKSG